MLTLSSRQPADAEVLARCGEPLWEPCVHCGATSPAGERFCGDCGANLAAALHQQTEQFEMHLLTVEQLQAEGRYEEAVALLAPISGATHPRLTQHAAQAAEIIKQLTAQREKAHRRRGNIAQGQRLLAEHDYERAASLLDGVPAYSAAPNCNSFSPRPASGKTRFYRWTVNSAPRSKTRMLQPCCPRSAGCWS